jgi:hypothetical protein
MKYFFYLFASILSMLFWGCSRYCCDYYHPNDVMYAERDSVLWNAVASGNISSSDSLNMKGIGANNGNRHDTLTFQVKYKGPGTYSLNPAFAFYHSSVGNGPPFNSYKLDTLFRNTLVVSSYDQTTGNLEGSFSIKFTNPADPAGIRFLYGNFKVVLNK